jgi:hypothetical protein
MGFDSRHIFPRLCDWAMRDPRFVSLRRDLLAHADGEILEVAIQRRLADGCRSNLDIEGLGRVDNR